MNPIFIFRKQRLKISLTHTVGLLLFMGFMQAQEADAQQKSRRRIDVDYADYAISSKTVIPNAQRLIGNVRLLHEGVVMTCDSAWHYSDRNVVDAFGNVHIVSNDTLHMYASYINYNSDLSLAKARHNVSLTDPSMTLTTDSLDYDMANDIGYYNFGGKIVDSTNVLTSIIGRYYTQTKEVFFKDSVVVVHEDFTIYSDTLKYNTETEVAHIVGPTRIIGDSTYIYSENGWYNTKLKISQLQKNSILKRADTQMQGDTIYFDDNDASGWARGNVIINDFKNQVIVAGHNATYNDFSQNALVRDSALFILYDESDSLFLHADNLFTMPDTTEADAKIIMCYNDVRFFKTDIQGICDSLVYFSKDSTIHLHTEPLLWSNENQMSADFIEVINNTVPPNEVILRNNSFIIQQVDSTKFNQIKGKNMTGYIRDNQLYLVDVSGNGQSIYYPSDENGVFGINSAESSNIKLYLAKNKIQRINFVTTPTGVMDPLQLIETGFSNLDGFNWRDAIRPKNKYQIFSDKEPYPTRMPLNPIREQLPPIHVLKKLEEMQQSQQSETEKQMPTQELENRLDENQDENCEEKPSDDCQEENQLLPAIERPSK